MDTYIEVDTGAEMIDKTYKNEIKLKSRKVKGEVLDLQNGAAFLSGVKIRGGTGSFFFLRIRQGSAKMILSHETHRIRGNLVKIVLFK